jgi:HAD superfamily hydrolase (TIGR01509 family)
MEDEEQLIQNRHLPTLDQQDSSCYWWNCSSTGPSLTTIDKRHARLCDRMVNEKPLRAVIFDMDGVLCDSEPFLCEASQKMFTMRYGIEVQQEDFLPFVGTGEDRYLGGVAEGYGIELSMPADKELTYEIYLDVIRNRLQPLPGVLQFVEDCRRWNLKLAVATSADRVKMEGNLREIGLPPDLFDTCITGSEVERKKPDPQIFQVAAGHLDCNNPECLVVEDAPMGVSAAVQADSPCLGITSSFSEEELRSAGADWVVPDLHSIPSDLLNRLRGENYPSPKGIRY